MPGMVTAGLARKGVEALVGPYRSFFAEVAEADGVVVALGGSDRTADNLEEVGAGRGLLLGFEIVASAASLDGKFLTRGQVGCSDPLE